jgi:hypothetical protein
MGFFECIDNKEAAFLLFDTAKNWLQENGMQAMDGPINFGENDNFWGLLVEGFTPPSYGMNYNPPYYKAFFEDMVLKPCTSKSPIIWMCTSHFQNGLPKLPIGLSKNRVIVSSILKQRKLKSLLADFIEIYNDAWQDFENFVPINQATILESFEKMKAIMDEKLIWFAYINNEPASFIVILPDANQMIKPLTAKLNLFGKLIFFTAVERRIADAGHRNGHQTKIPKTRARIGLFIKLKEYVLPLKQYDELELSWVGDFNEKMIAIHAAVGATFGKKHLTMRYILNGPGIVVIRA